jgi:hypothetical protein
VELPEDIKNVPIRRLSQKDDAQLWAALDYVRGKADENGG